QYSTPRGSTRKPPSFPTAPLAHPTACYGAPLAQPSAGARRSAIFCSVSGASAESKRWFVGLAVARCLFGPGFDVVPLRSTCSTVGRGSTVGHLLLGAIGSASCRGRDLVWV